MKTKNLKDQKSSKIENNVKTAPFVAEEFAATEEETLEILEKDSILAKASTAKKERAEKKEKKEKKETIHRGDSVFEAIRELCTKEGATIRQVMDRANEIHVSKGGNSNETATNINRYSIQALVAFDVLTVVNGKYLLK